MNDLISRSALIADFDMCNNRNAKWTPQRVKTLLVRATAVDAVDVEHGRWEMAFDNWCPHCSVCGEEPYRASNNDLPNFCPNCGADMRERKGDDATD